MALDERVRPLVAKRLGKKTAHYTLQDGSDVAIFYDPEAPCRVCGLPVLDASVGGTDLCPWCDCGNYRDGTSHGYDSATTIRLRAKAMAPVDVSAQYPSQIPGSVRVTGFIAPPNFGDCYFDSASGKLKTWNGTAWLDVGETKSTI